MDLQSLQYQMLLAVQKHQLLMGKRKLEPENGSLKKEILEVLCQLIDINDKQKSVVSQLRAEKEAVQQHQHQKHQEHLSVSHEEPVTDLDLACSEQMLHESVDPQNLSVVSLPRSVVVNTIKSHHDTALTYAQSASSQCNGQTSSLAKPAGTSSPAHCHGLENGSNSHTPDSQRKHDRLLELQEFRNQGRRVSPVDGSSSQNEEVGRECPRISVASQDGFQDSHQDGRQDGPQAMSDFLGQDLGQKMDNLNSPEKRLSHFSPPTADYNSEDIHDLVTAEEFMNAIGLLTVRECDEVITKRHERRKRNQNRHIFSVTLWEKPEKRRKRRDWLAAAVGSPPNLRNKPRPSSAVPKGGLQSGPPSPLQSSCSPPASQLSSQPPSPASTENDTPTPTPPSSEEICPICKLKGADVLCEGCGVIYHGACVDLGSNCAAPLGWLCATCEQLGLRASSSTSSMTRAPQHLSSRREMLMAREELLHQRARLTIDKLQLEERKRFLSQSLAIQKKERKELENKEHNVHEAIHKLKSFIATFQKSPPQYPIQAATLGPARTHPHIVKHSQSNSHSPSEIFKETSPPSTSSNKLHSAALNTLARSKQQKSFYTSNSCSISSASFPTSTKVVSSPSLLHCSTFSSFPALTKVSYDKTGTLAVPPLLSLCSSSPSAQQVYSPKLSHPRPASPSIGRASYPQGSPSPGLKSFSQRTLSPGPPSYPHINQSSEPPRAHTCYSPEPIGQAFSYPPHGSPPSPEHHTYSYSRTSSSLGQASTSLRLASPVTPVSLERSSTSPQDLSLHPVSHLHKQGSNLPTISGSSDKDRKCPNNNANSQSIKFPFKRKLGISDSVFHDNKNGLATCRRNESDVMTASS